MHLVILGVSGTLSLPRLTSFDLKKSKGQIDQWRVMDFLKILMDFLNGLKICMYNLNSKFKIVYPGGIFHVNG